MVGVGVLMGGAGSEVRLTAGVVVVCGGVWGGDRLILAPQLLGWTQSERAGRVSFPGEFLGGVSTTVPEPLGVAGGGEVQSPLTAISGVSPVDEALSGGADDGSWLSDFDIEDFLHVFVVGGDLEHGTGRVLDTRDVDRDDVGRHSLPSHVVPIAMDTKNLCPQSEKMGVLAVLPWILVLSVRLLTQQRSTQFVSHHASEPHFLKTIEFLIIDNSL